MTTTTNLLHQTPAGHPHISPWRKALVAFVRRDRATVVDPGSAVWPGSGRQIGPTSGGRARGAGRAHRAEGALPRGRKKLASRHANSRTASGNVNCCVRGNRQRTRQRDLTVRDPLRPLLNPWLVPCRASPCGTTQWRPQRRERQLCRPTSPNRRRAARPCSATFGGLEYGVFWSWLRRRSDPLLRGGPQWTRSK
jgi:hypothetical protein